MFRAAVGRMLRTSKIVRALQPDRSAPMYATTTSKRSQRTDGRIGLVLVMLLGLLTAGAILTVERVGAPPVVVGPQPNTLPEAVIVRPMSYEQIRFIEMNVLPEARSVQSLDAERLRLIDINRLPGDGANVAPAGDRPGVRY
jgi:hypothetical protein